MIMSHQIETFGSEAAFASARILPWTKLGTVTANVMTAEEALHLAHLDNWQVRMAPLMAQLGEAELGRQLSVPNKFAIIRNNPFVKDQIDVLGVGGKQYVPVQNEAHAEFLNVLVDIWGAHFETAGSVKDGHEVFITMKAPDSIQIGGVDPVDTYIAAVNSHDGSKAFRVVTTPVRIVCANTLRAALAGAKSSVSIRHTAGAGGTVERARKALGVTFKYMETFQAEAEKMIQQTLTNARFDKVVAQLYPYGEKMSDLQISRQQDNRYNVKTLFRESPTATAIRGTNWAGYQAVTEYVDYVKDVPSYKGRSPETARAEHNMAGEYDAIKEQAFKLLAVH